MFTSGTTGSPKKVTHNFNSLNRHVVIKNEFNKAVWGLAYSPTHIAGIQVIFQSILNKSTLVRLFGLKREEVSEQIIVNKITHISATPTFYRLNLPLSSKAMNVLRVSSGGEPYNEKLGNLLSKSFPNAKIKNIYASTEYGTLFASTGEYFTIKKKYDDKVRIVKNQIEVHKSLVNLKNIKTHEDWYRTGDIVKFDKQKRNFKILGRDTDAINIGGFLVNLLEIESYILNIDGIRNCRVYAKK